MKSAAEHLAILILICIIALVAGFPVVSLTSKINDGMWIRELKQRGLIEHNQGTGDLQWTEKAWVTHED